MLAGQEKSLLGSAVVLQSTAALSGKLSRPFPEGLIFMANGADVDYWESIVYRKSNILSWVWKLKGNYRRIPFPQKCVLTQSPLSYNNSSSTYVTACALRQIRSGLRKDRKWKVGLIALLMDFVPFDEHYGGSNDSDNSLGFLQSLPNFGACEVLMELSCGSE